MGWTTKWLMAGEETRTNGSKTNQQREGYSLAELTILEEEIWKTQLQIIDQLVHIQSTL
jgi:hypothetical protein